jgi:hypothetical protein
MYIENNFDVSTKLLGLLGIGLQLYCNLIITITPLCTMKTTLICQKNGLDDKIVGNTRGYVRNVSIGGNGSPHVGSFTIAS